MKLPMRIVLACMLCVVVTSDGAAEEKNVFLNLDVSQETMPPLPAAVLEFVQGVTKTFISKMGTKDYKKLGYARYLTPDELEEMQASSRLPPGILDEANAIKFYQSMSFLGNTMNGKIGNSHDKGSAYPTLGYASGTAKSGGYLTYAITSMALPSDVLSAGVMRMFGGQNIESVVGEPKWEQAAWPLLVGVPAGSLNAIAFPTLRQVQPAPGETFNYEGWITPRYVVASYTVTTQPYPLLSYQDWNTAIVQERARMTVVIPSVTMDPLWRPIRNLYGEPHLTTYRQAYEAAMNIVYQEMYEANERAYQVALKNYKDILAAKGKPKDSQGRDLGEPPPNPLKADGKIAVTIKPAKVDLDFKKNYLQKFTDYYGKNITYENEATGPGGGTTVRTNKATYGAVGDGQVNCSEIEVDIDNRINDPNAYGCLLSGKFEAVFPWKGGEVTGNPAEVHLMGGGYEAQMRKIADDKQTEQGFWRACRNFMKNFIATIIQGFIGWALTGMALLAALIGWVLSVFAGHFIHISMTVALMLYPAFAVATLFKPTAILEWGKGVLFISLCAIPVSLGTAIIFNCVLNPEFLINAGLKGITAIAGTATGGGALAFAGAIGMGMNDNLILQLIGCLIGSVFILTAPALVMAVINPSASALAQMTQSIFSAGIKASTQAAMGAMGAALVAGGVATAASKDLSSAAQQGSNTVTPSSTTTSNGTAAPATSTAAPSAASQSTARVGATGKLVEAADSTGSNTSGWSDRMGASMKAMSDRVGEAVKAMPGEIAAGAKGQVGKLRDLAEQARQEGPGATTGMLQDRVGAGIKAADIADSGVGTGADRSDTRSEGQKAHDRRQAMRDLEKSGGNKGAVLQGPGDLQTRRGEEATASATISGQASQRAGDPPSRIQTASDMRTSAQHINDALANGDMQSARAMSSELEAGLKTPSIGSSWSQQEARGSAHQAIASTHETQATAAAQEVQKLTSAMSGPGVGAAERGAMESAVRDQQTLEGRHRAAAASHLAQARTNYTNASASAARASVSAMASDPYRAAEAAIGALDAACATNDPQVVAQASQTISEGLATHASRMGDGPERSVIASAISAVQAEMSQPTPPASPAMNWSDVASMPAQTQSADLVQPTPGQSESQAVSTPPAAQTPAVTSAPHGASAGATTPATPATPQPTEQEWSQRRVQLSALQAELTASRAKSTSKLDTVT